MIMAGTREPAGNSSAHLVSSRQLPKPRTSPNFAPPAKFFVVKITLFDSNHNAPVKREMALGRALAESLDILRISNSRDIQNVMTVVEDGSTAGLVITTKAH
jgi:hypothetical protein